MNGRRVFVTWFGLIVLYTAVTRSEKVAGLLGVTTELTRRLSDPNVPLIANRSGAQLGPGSGAGPRSNAAGDVYGQQGGQYIGGTFVPYTGNASVAVYGSTGGSYQGSTFVPAGK